MESVLSYVGSVGGVGAVFGFLMWIILRWIIRQMREDRKFMEDRLTKIISDYNVVCQANQEALVKHTQIQTELIVWLKAKNGSTK